MPPFQYLFVYGTLRRARDGSLHDYLKNRATFFDTATFPGRLYLLGDYPGAVWAAPGDGNLVHGEVFRLPHPEAVLHHLDRYEECSAEFPQPHEYTRQLKTVALSSGHSLQAWVYVYNRPAGNLFRIESGDYTAHLPRKHR